MALHIFFINCIGDGMGEESKSACQAVGSWCTDPQKSFTVLGALLGYAIPSIVYYAMKPEKPDDNVPAYIGVPLGLAGARLGNKLGKSLKDYLSSQAGQELVDDVFGGAEDVELQHLDQAQAPGHPYNPMPP